MPVITDTSPLHYLILIGKAHLLPALYGKIVVPDAVVQELRHASAPEEVRSWVRALPSWCDVRAPRCPVPGELSRLGAGEREAVLLAQEGHGGLLLLDDTEGRRAARRRALPVTGTLGVLGQAAERGLVDFPKAALRLHATSFRMPPPDVLASILTRYTVQ
jgi:predicted nucleic acid-binding protein